MPRDIIVEEPMPDDKGLPTPQSIREAIRHAVTGVTASGGGDENDFGELV